MASGLQGPARLCLRILLWLVGAVMLFVVALLVNMELNIARHGGWEMAEGIGFVFGLLFIVYYSIVLVLGRIMLRRGGPQLGLVLRRADNDPCRLAGPLRLVAPCVGRSVECYGREKRVASPSERFIPCVGLQRTLV